MPGERITGLPAGPRPGAPWGRMESPATPPPLARALFGLGFVLLAVVLLRTAWISDDAQITFRTVLNWTHGWGARWNVIERVQGYTHPLWMLLLTGLYLVAGELYVSTMVASLLLSLAGVRLAVRGAAPGPAAVAVFALVASKAFVDYGTSGLESPLAFVLLAGLLQLAAATPPDPTPRRASWLVLLAALVFLVRFDLVLLAGPVLLAVLSPRLLLGRRRRTLMVGAMPALAWLGAAALYYGSPLPNTFHAKLGAQLPVARQLEVGWAYLRASARFDPATPVLLLLSLALAARARGRVERAAGLAILAYLAYTVWIGGDFMLGRFLAVPALVAAWLVARCGREDAGAALAGCLAFTGLGLAAHGPNLLAGGDYARTYPATRTAPYFFMDERAYYFASFGLLASDRPPFPATGWPEAAPLRVPDAVQVWGAGGLYGVGHGPRFHIVDEHALTDAFLARLPARRDWEPKPGHLVRRIPEGYLESIRSGENRLVDPGLRELYDAVVRVTRGPLLAPGRLGAALRLFLGGYDHLVDARRYQFLELPEVPADLPVVRGLDRVPLPPGPVPVQAPGVFRFPAPGVVFELAAPVRLGVAAEAATLRMHRLMLRFYLGEAPVGVAELRGEGRDGTLLDPEVHALPRALWGRQVDRVVLQVPPDLGGGALATLRFPADPQGN